MREEMMRVGRRKWKRKGKGRKEAGEGDLEKGEEREKEKKDSGVIRIKCTKPRV